MIGRAKKVHGNKYDYSKITNYKNSHTKVPIICPIHGEFMMNLNHHIGGQGCPKCVGKHKTTSEVIEQFRKIHGDDFIYDKVQYTNNSTKVCIICPIHGEFWQTPDKHLQGQGCPKCKSSKLEKSVRAFLINNKIKFEEQKRFSWLGKQSLDFYLPQYKIAIECQGEQHFKEYNNIEKLTRIKNINERIKLDITKNVLCNENEIKMIYIFSKKWKNKSLTKQFNGIYTNQNIILDKELDKIKQVLSS